MDGEYEFKTVIISYDDDTQPIEVDVVVGDGKTTFDENFEFDARVYFYFKDQAEYESAKGVDILPDIEFRIVEEVE